ncbi:MAG: sulfite exporter TauE/SafE family protein [Chloroflexota bacterium]|nr:sulfite exporter TauE/SafE family protein [Chloroflexota bacterium]
MSPDNVRIVVTLAVVTFALGVLLGFIGAGGAGIVVALLTTTFGLPVHQAIGTALAMMCFVTISGAVSHYREGNVAPKVGLVTGLTGAVGAIVGADTSQAIPEPMLQMLAGAGLLMLAALVWARTQFGIGRAGLVGEPEWAGEPGRSPVGWGLAGGLGLTGGAAAAFLGVGMAPYLQLGFLAVLRLPLRQTIGTTMMALIFISAAGAIALARHGDVSLPHLIGTTLGVASGAFLGARLTKRMPRPLLRIALVGAPLIAGGMLLLF